MKFSEIRVIIPPDTDARDLEARAKGVAERIELPIKIIGATIHARPTEGYSNRNDGAIFIIDESSEPNRNFYTFAGHMAYMHGMPVVNVRKLGEKTLSLKGDTDAVEDFIADSLGETSDDGDDDYFSISGGFNDKADDDERFNMDVDNE